MVILSSAGLERQRRAHGRPAPSPRTALPDEDPGKSRPQLRFDGIRRNAGSRRKSKGIVGRSLARVGKTEVFSADSANHDERFIIQPGMPAVKGLAAKTRQRQRRASEVSGINE